MKALIKERARAWHLQVIYMKKDLEIMGGLLLVVDRLNPTTFILIMVDFVVDVNILFTFFVFSHTFMFNFPLMITCNLRTFL